MSEPNTCPSCGAVNPRSASWCNLCFERFDQPAPKSVIAQEAPSPTRTDHDSPAPPEPPPPPVHEEGEQLALLGGDVSGAKTWMCRFCDTKVPVGQVQCPACQQTIYDSFGGRRPAVELEPMDALRRSLLPGGGHFALEQGIVASTILAVTFISLGMGRVLLSTGLVTYGSLLTFIGLTIWMLAAHDAFRIASGHGDEIFLRPRALSIVMGIWFMIVIGAAVAAQRAIN